MYNVGPYTLAAHKVVWRRMDRQIRAAVVGEIDHPVAGTPGIGPPGNLRPGGRRLARAKPITCAGC